ncbi:MAG: hypothetical protein RLZZ383_937 [Pseudomonadota bacterium]
MAAAQDDDLLFADEAPDVASPEIPATPWVVLLVDDEPNIHMVSRLAFGRLQVEGRPLTLLRADTAAQGRALLSSRDDIAVAILDVVMETDDAGLRLAAWIRDQPRLRAMRIILRTGQPGHAPEEEVLRRYDINDYWPKTELTAHRSRTLLTGQIRSYRDLQLIEAQRNDLGRVISAIGELFTRGGVRTLLEGIVQQFQRLLRAEHALLAIFDVHDPEAFDRTHLLIASGEHAEPRLDDEARAMLRESRMRSRLVVRGDRVALFNAAGDARGAGLFVRGIADMDEWAEHTLELLSRNALSVLNAQIVVEEQRELLTAIERFVPSPLVHMAGRPDVRDVQVGDHRLTSSWVVFGDLQGFTSISEALAPAEVHATLQTAFGAVLPALLEAGAVIDKFLGDGFLALFPGDGPPPLIACRAALAALDGLNAARVTSGQAPLRMGMSIHGGPVLFCTLGHEARVEITAVSDTVNVASRLEAMTRNYGCQLLVSEAVADAVDAPTRATLRPLGRVPVRGRAGRIGVFEADGHTDDAHASAEVLERLVDRIERQDPEARAALAALRQRYPDDQTLTGLQLVLERR